MIYRLFCRYGGYCRVRIISSFRERFLNTLIMARIPVWSVNEEGIHLSFNLRLSDMDRFREIAAECGVNAVVTARFGAVNVADVVRKYRYGIMSAAALLLLFLDISGRIWNVNIYGTRLTDADSVRVFLHENGCSTGMKKDMLRKNELELLIKNEFAEISEVVSEINGTDLNITVFEAEAPIVAYDRDVAVDIVAVRDCVIDEIDVYNGKGMVKAGDSVKKGDVLISGRIDYLFKGEEKYKNVHALGKTLSYEKVFCDNITVDMYVPDTGSGYFYERKIYFAGKCFTMKNVTDTTDMVMTEKKNMQISLGWLKIPILYDEIRWYNKADCTLKSSDAIYTEVFEKASGQLPDGCSIRNLSYVAEELPGNRLSITAGMECAVNAGTEREIDLREEL